jgi:hypothetical protein
MFTGGDWFFVGLVTIVGGVFLLFVATQISW